MEAILLIVTLAIISYYLIRRNTAPITTTPIWLLWLVMMIPVFVWAALLAAFGSQGLPAPLIVLFLFFSLLVCPFIYRWLVLRGSKSPSPSGQKADPATGDENLGVTPTVKKKKSVRPISAQEEKALRDCFPFGVYYLQTIDYYPQAILCRGKLRTIPDRAYQTIKDNVEKLFGDRFLILFQESLRGQPFFALVPNPQAAPTGTVTTDSPEGIPPAPKMPPEPITRPGLAFFLFTLTLLTTTIFGADFQGITPEALFADGDRFLQGALQGMGYSVPLLIILGCHEFAHYFTAVHYGIRTTLPYFIPFPFLLGTFGAFIQMRSPVPHRRALFDVSLAGPVGGLVATIPFLGWGLAHSQVVPLGESNSLIDFQASNPRISLLLALCTKLVLGSSFQPDSALQFHPMAIAGCIGLIVTALNLMPVGQLDGGHIVHAMFGQKKGVVIGQVSRICMIIWGLQRPDYLVWAIFLLFLPVVDQPALNDVTELDDRRDFLGLGAIALLLLIMLPLPPVVAQWLNM